jgi:hypothetical protein
VFAGIWYDLLASGFMFKSYIYTSMFVFTAVVKLSATVSWSGIYAKNVTPAKDVFVSRIGTRRYVPEELTATTGGSLWAWTAVIGMDGYVRSVIPTAVNMRSTRL